MLISLQKPSHVGRKVTAASYMATTGAGAFLWAIHWTKAPNLSSKLNCLLLNVKTQRNRTRVAQTASTNENTAEIREGRRQRGARRDGADWTESGCAVPRGAVTEGRSAVWGGDRTLRNISRL